MDKSQGNLVNHVIFQCPNEKERSLVAPTVHGNLIVGPDSQPSAANDVSTTKQGLDFVRNTALKSVPGINFRESIRNFAGVRARTADHDFHIYERQKQQRVYQYRRNAVTGIIIRMCNCTRYFKDA